MYKVGNFWKPTEENGHDYWTLDIDFVDTENSGRPEHGALLQIHGESMSQCLLKAKHICIVLNSEGFTTAEVLVKLLDVSKITFEK